MRGVVSSMAEKAKNNYMKFSIILAVVCIALMYNANTSSFTTLVSSVAGEMMQVDMLPTQIGWLISITSLLMIPGVLLSGLLTRVMSMRNIMILGWAIFGLSGAGIYFMHTTMGILVMRAVMGFAIGLSQPSSKAIPSRLYEGNDRNNVMGYISMGGGIISVIISILFGQVGLINWRYTMFFYLAFSVIFIVLALLFIPNLPPEAPARSQTAGKKRPLGIATWAMVFCGFYCFLIGAVIQIKTSTFVQELGLGGSDVAGYVSAANTVGIIICGMFFGRLQQLLGRWLYPLALAISTGAYFVFANGNNVVVLCLSGAVICGFSFGIVMAYNIARVTFTAPRERITTAITIVTLATYIGQVCTTPLLNLVASIWDGSSRTALLFVGAAFGLLTVISVVWILLTRNKKLSAD